MVLHTIIVTAGLLVSQGRYDGMSIANIRIDNPQQLEMLRNAGIRSLACFDHAGATPMLLDDAMIKFVKKHHIEIEIIETDIDQRLKNFEHQREVARNRGLGGWYNDYKTWGEVNEKIALLASNAPDITSTFIAGTSHEGRNIHGIRITGPGDASDRPSVLFNGCQHAREWVAVMVPVYVAEYLIEGWNEDPEIQSLLESTQVISVPIVNPDGYEYTYASNGDRFWRKNRRVNGGFCLGVDLNRNWDIDWNGGDSTSTNSCSDVFVGPYPFSEPEAQSLRDLIDEETNLVAHIDFHNYSQLVLEAWAYTYDPPERINVIKALSGSMSEAIEGVHGEIYLAGGSELLYPADGTFQDWSSFVGALGYTIELRPTGSPGFDLPPDQILPTCEENFAAAVAMLRFVNEPITFTFPTGIPQFVQQGQLHAFDITIESIFDDPIDEDSATLHVRYGSDGTFASRQLQSNGNGMYTVELPVSMCGLSSEYYFTVALQDGETTRYPQGEEVLTVGVSTTLIGWNMDIDPNWTTQGLWGWGTPLGGGGEDHGNPDPTSGATGVSVMGYNLAGDYENNLGETHLTTAPFDLSDQESATLRFKRHLNVEQPVYDHATVSVRVGNGSWSDVWTNQSTVEDDQWMDVSYDITDIAGGQEDIRIRWTMGTTDSAWQYSGWNIDDIEIITTSNSGIQGDVNCDGVVSITDILSIISTWGECATVCNEDIVPDGMVNVSDLLQVIGNW